jgi:hypothetical protein
MTRGGNHGNVAQRHASWRDEAGEAQPGPRKAIGPISVCLGFFVMPAVTALAVGSAGRQYADLASRGRRLPARHRPHHGDPQ